MQVCQRVLLENGAERGGITQRASRLKQDLLEIADTEEGVGAAARNEVDGRVGAQAHGRQRLVEAGGDIKRIPNRDFTPSTPQRRLLGGAVGPHALAHLRAALADGIAALHRDHVSATGLQDGSHRLERSRQNGVRGGGGGGGVRQDVIDDAIDLRLTLPSRRYIREGGLIHGEEPGVGLHAGKGTLIIGVDLLCQPTLHAPDVPTSHVAQHDPHTTAVVLLRQQRRRRTDGVAGGAQQSRVHRHDGTIDHEHESVGLCIKRSPHTHR